MNFVILITFQKLYFKLQKSLIKYNVNVKIIFNKFEFYTESQYNYSIKLKILNKIK